MNIFEIAQLICNLIGWFSCKILYMTILFLIFNNILLFLIFNNILLFFFEDCSIHLLGQPTNIDILIINKKNSTI